MVRTHLQRYPILGDKLASRNCQKGTIGAVVRECHLPMYAETGIVPSLIMNSASVLKRETYG